MLWVIPCYFDPIVFECVDSIRTHFPDDEILVVDSCSPDQSYLDELDVDPVEVGNQHRHVGTWGRALAYSHDRFALIHDSLIVNGHWTPGDFQVVRWFHEGGPVGDQRPFIFDEAARMGLEISNGGYFGIFGPMLFCTRRVLEDFESVGLLDSKPTTAIEAACCERLSGIAATHLGYSVTADSLQGGMSDFHGKYDEVLVAKKHRGRP